MNSPIPKLKIEENAVNVVLVFDKDTDAGFFNEVLSRLKTLSFKHRKNKFVLYVLTGVEKPLFFEKARSILMNNVVFTITVRSINQGLFNELIAEFTSRGEPVYVMIDKSLADRGLFSPPSNFAYLELI